MDRWDVLSELAARQLGLLHIRQALAAGVARSTIYGQAERRGWELAQSRVLALPGMPWCWEREAGAAVLSLSPRALVARRSAAYLWGLIERTPRPIELVVPADRSVRAPSGCTVSRSTSLLRCDASMARGIPVTAVPRTLCDLASAPIGFDDLVESIAVAVQKRLVTLDEVRVYAERLGPFRGSVRAREAIEALSGRRTDSAAERALLTDLTVAGIPPDETLYPLHDETGRLVAVLDMVYLRAKVDVEVNGYAFHATPRQQARDDDRRNAILELGWFVLAISAHKILKSPEQAVAQVRRVLERRYRELGIE